MNKVKLFRHVFKGREDVVAKYWQSRSGKQGWSPLCRNEWKKGICQKPCRTCSHASYVPLSDELVLDHFYGKKFLGIYPLTKDNTCHFVASDFDNHNGEPDPLIHIRAVSEVCDVQEIPLYVLRSRSGRGYHAYVFFEDPTPAWKARCVMFALLEESQVARDHDSSTSLDCLFPNQDRLSGKGIGNLIALPFQGAAARLGNTLFLDPDTGFKSPYSDQFSILSNTQRVTETRLDQLIHEWNLTGTRPKAMHSSGQPVEKHVGKLMQCDFIRWCRENPTDVPEPLWYALISNLASIRPGGYSLCHQFSREYPTYTHTETDAKILHALDSSGPHTCKYINENGFNCAKVCTVKSPVALTHKGRRSGYGEKNS